MAEQEWEKFKNLNACLQAEKAGELTIETVTIVASFTKLGKVSKVVSALDDLDAFSQVAKLSGKLIKPVVKTGSKSVKFVLNERVSFISRTQIRVKGLGCLFPYVEIRFKDKLNTIDDLTLQKKVSASIEEKGGLDKLPTDENGNKIVEITIEGEKTSVLIGTNEGLEKVGKEVKDAIKKKLDDIEKEFLTDTFKDLLTNKFKNYKGVLNFDDWAQRYKTLYKNRKIGKLTEEQFQLLEGGTKPKKGISTSDGKRYFDNVLDGTAREIKSGNVTLSKKKNKF